MDPWNGLFHKCIFYFSIPTVVNMMLDMNLSSKSVEHSTVLYSARYELEKAFCSGHAYVACASTLRENSMLCKQEVLIHDANI